MHKDKNDLGIVCGLFLFVLMTMMLVASIHDGTSTSPPCKSANCFNISLNYSELIEQDTALNRTLNEHIGEHFFCKGFAKSCAKMITFNDFPSHWPSMRLTDTITYFYFKLCSTFFTTKSWSIHIFKLTLTHCLHFSAMKKSQF